MQQAYRRAATYGSVAIAIAVFILGIVLSPAGISALASSDLKLLASANWPLASIAGQAYQGVSAILAGMALLMVGASIAYQAKQTKIAQLQAARSFQLALFSLAYEHADLQDGWSRSVDLPYPEWRLRSYVNLVFAYLRMSYEVGATSDAELQRTLENRFRTELGRKYWSSSRLAWQTGSTNRRRRRFLRIAEEAYKAATSGELKMRSTTSSQPLLLSNSASQHSPRSSGIPELVTLATGVGVGILLAEVLRNLARTRRWNR